MPDSSRVLSSDWALRPPSCADSSLQDSRGPAQPSVEVAILAEGVSVNRAYLAAMERGVLIPEESSRAQEHWQTFAWPHCCYDLYSRRAALPIHTC